jgi:hypothetical protein
VEPMGIEPTTSALRTPDGIHADRKSTRYPDSVNLSQFIYHGSPGVRLHPTRSGYTPVKLHPTTP